MILPTKHLREDRALITLGGELLGELREAKTVSRLWSEIHAKRAGSASPLTYDWFVLGLDLLFMIGAIDFDGGRVRRTRQ